ncbi:Replication protein A 30 kDa subunit [Cricetulus griseus]|uniref:Replication protein A 30 kDa subunit n=1 Tax=Cricetulus griseus TaxID=10029 RepID=G3HWN4_CRIGR|nr:Replication protein A 30 kDa subunit [Cricetulus griseus]
MLGPHLVADWLFSKVLRRWHSAIALVRGWRCHLAEIRETVDKRVSVQPVSEHLLLSSHQILPRLQKMMSKSGFGSNDSFVDDDGANRASGSDEQAGGQDLGLPMTTLTRPGIHSIVPCCISQLLTAVEVDNVFKIRGFALHRVSIVGMIMEAKKASRYMMYKIDDMTAKAIEARQPLSRERVRQCVIPLPVGVYAKVLGVLQSSEGTRRLGVLSIRVLEDMNELSTHTLEVVNAHMMLDQSREGVSTGRHLLEEAPAGAAAARVAKAASLNFIHLEVLRLIQECPHQEGKAISELRRDLHALTDEAVTQAIRHLISTQRISATSDSEYLKISG